jgi:hypothetical protein
MMMRSTVMGRSFLRRIGGSKDKQCHQQVSDLRSGRSPSTSARACHAGAVSLRRDAQTAIAVNTTLCSSYPLGRSSADCSSTARTKPSCRWWHAMPPRSSIRDRSGAPATIRNAPALGRSLGGRRPPRPGGPFSCRPPVQTSAAVARERGPLVLRGAFGRAVVAPAHPPTA